MGRTEETVECDTIGSALDLSINALSRATGAQQSGAPIGREVPVRTPDFETTDKNIYAVGDGAELRST